MIIYMYESRSIYPNYTYINLQIRTEGSVQDKKRVSGELGRCQEVAMYIYIYHNHVYVYI